jgi:hypothetical protein
VRGRGPAESDQEREQNQEESFLPLVEDETAIAQDEAKEIHGQTRLSRPIAAGR